MYTTNNKLINKHMIIMAQKKMAQLKGVAIGKIWDNLSIK